MSHLDSNDSVEIYLDNRATELVKDDAGRVASVKSEDTDGNTYTFTANQGVLISTGGFGGNGELIQSFNTDGKWPDLSNRKISNISTIEGDGIKMGQDIGAGVTGMEHIQLLFTTEPKTGQAGIANFSPLGTAGYLFVNQEDERFVRENGRRDEISLAMLEQTDQIGYMLQSASSSEIVHDETTDLNGVPLQPLIEQGYIHYGKTLEEAAEKAGVPYETLQATIDSYNEAVESGAEEDELGRHLLVNKLEGEGWYLVPRSPAIHHTMGGLVIDTDAHVLDENNEIIPGLYAAGEVTGGIHGANRLGGNAVTDTIVFGRTAGQSILEDSQ